MLEQFHLDQWPDLILEINTSPLASNQVRFAFRGISRGVQVHDFGFVDIIEPAIYVRNLIAEINRWADPRKSDDVQAVFSHLEGIGIRLFKDLLPSAFKEYYWSDLHTQQAASVLLVPNGLASDIPWEMIKPEKPVETMFWCEHLALSRWVSDQPLVIQMPGTPAVCVLGDNRLHSVSAPVEQTLGISRDQLIETWTSLLQILESEGVGIFNWTGHGFAHPDNPSLNSLPIGGETFRPLDLLPARQRRFVQTGPWVFLHACSTAQIGQTFTGLGGWPTDLIEAGAGAVLATAWDVNTATASRFAEALYPILLDGVPVAEAVRRARIIARVENDPSWLAYQLYAYPLAQIVRSQTRCTRTHWTLRQMMRAVFGHRSAQDMEWRKPYLEWIINHPHYADKHIIPLAGTIKHHEPLTFTAVYVDDQRGGEAVVQEYKDIEQALDQYRAIVLLGTSGAGKTTTLYHLLHTLAQRGLNGEYGIPTPVYISLAQYELADTPLEYVRKHCASVGLKERLEDELLAGRICLLCDALGDMPGAEHEYLSKVRAWREFISTYANNFFVFACRTDEYHGELHIQPIVIQTLDNERIQRYLSRVMGFQADDMWKALQSSNLLDVARLPLFLDLIVQAYRDSNGRMPDNRGMLLKGLIDDLLKREQERGGMSEADIQSLTVSLMELAYQIQPRAARKVLPTNQVRNVLSDALLRTAISTGILEETSDGIRFALAQIREYFAALALLVRFEQGQDLRSHWKAPHWRQSVIEGPEMSERWAVLSPPPPTGWEEPTIFAAGLIKQKTKFIQAICSVNPWLAGQCLVDVLQQVPDGVAEQVRLALLKEITSRRMPLAHRNVAGRVLGQIGDPRFKVISSASGIKYISPVLVTVPTGIVWLGSDERDALAFPDEWPRHPITVPEFRIGRYPVTNAEFECFINAGGYDQPDYWIPAGWQWRQSPDRGEGSLSRILRNLAYHREHLYDLERWFREANISLEERELWYTLIKLDQHSARELLLNLGFGHLRLHDRPAYWDDPRYNGKNQPVVGVNWYEAMAYCAWLTRVLGRLVCLPTEVQWERAAKGDKQWIYPWGNTWKRDYCNALPERVLQPTPVGIFPRGRSPVGCDDMVGNVFEWTRSLYKPYPYDARDGREEMEAEGVRVNRGGGWDSTPRVARCALRGDMCDPDTFDHNLGFRVVVD